jgi:3-isopropylmalate/(R)-2-methylmalate dehydratase large subunit
MMHDSSGPRRIADRLKRFGNRVWDPDRVVLVSDHFVHSSDPLEAEILQLTRNWASEHGISRFHELEGICHIVPVEYGYIRPGILMVGADSHTSTAGALGALAVPVGSTEMLGVLLTGQIWLKVPTTLHITWEGRLARGVMAKDMALFHAAQFGLDGANYRVVEFGGEAVSSLPLDERLVLTNMSIEIGAKAGIIPADEKVLSYLASLGVEGCVAEESDRDALFEAEFRFNASALAPLVAHPHSPANVTSVEEARGIRIHQAYIGACTGAKYHDLATAAEVVRGKKVAKGVRFLVAPASHRALRRAAKEGVLEALVEAGAVVLPPGCGACAGLGVGVMPPHERCISSTNRNFQGRMGSPLAEIYLANPATVAASAVEGAIADPRDHLS